MAFELFILAVVGIIAGMYGTLVGAANILTIPLMIFLGYPAHETIAVCRLGTVGMTVMGYYKFNKKKLVNHKIGLFVALFATIGSFFGAKLVLEVSSTVLEKIIGIFIIIILITVLLNKNIGLKERKFDKKNYILGVVLSLILGVYLGFIGLAVGTFLMYPMILVFGQTFLQSAGTMKIPGAIASLMAVIVFFVNGKLIWPESLIILLSLSIGSYFGAHYSDKIGNVWIRRLFITVSAIMALMLLF